MKKHYFLLSVILLQTFFFLVQLKNHNLYLKDSAEYLTEAANIADSGTFYAGSANQEINPALYTRRPPLYPLFIRFARIFSASDILVILLQNILSVLSIMLVRKTALEWGYKRNRDQWALLLLIFTPAQFIYANLVMSEILFQFILILMIRYFLRYLADKKGSHLLLYNLFIFIAAAVKPVMYLFVIPNLLFLAWLSVKGKSVRPVLTALIPLFLVLGYSQWNTMRSGRFEFSSIQTTNLVNYNTYYFLAKTHGEKYAENTVDSIYAVANKFDSYGERMAYLDHTAMKVIKAEPVKYSWFHFKGMVRFFLDP